MYKVTETRFFESKDDALDAFNYISRQEKEFANEHSYRCLLFTMGETRILDTFTPDAETHFSKITFEKCEEE